MISRTLNTSGTTLITLLAIFIFGGGDNSGICPYDACRSDCRYLLINLHCDTSFSRYAYTGREEIIVIYNIIYREGDNKSSSLFLQYLRLHAVQKKVSYYIIQINSNNIL